jgi:hypothetical protein
MKLQNYYQLLKDNEEKIPVIDRITDKHPGIGTELGWSWYTGGMTDTGNWYVEKLLQIPLYTLTRQLEIWEVKQKEAEEWAEETLKNPKTQRELLDEMNKKFERYLFWGK